MAHIALTPAASSAASSGDLVRQTMAVVQSGFAPGVVGVAGAALGVSALTTFLAPASIPMSVLAVVLGRRSRNVMAVGLGLAGIALAVTTVAGTDAFWLAVAATFGAFGG
ncbi:MAG: hypothetical protein D6826_03125 [Alphaproteobacteria bacterium]|nr:MAG: hypothetical protein D6826_03125 [Alphaproteobacteria bacterium]